MAFSTRVFCTVTPGPSVSELVGWLRQHQASVVVAGGASADALLDPFWTEVLLAFAEGEPPLRVLCRRDDAFRDERDDFLSDLAELPADDARGRVESHLRASTWVVVIEFPPDGVGKQGYFTNGWLMACFVEQAGGMVQCDGIGFYDAADELILELP